MSDSSNPETSLEARPDPRDLAFDLRAALSSIVAVRTGVADDALTAPILGTQRCGHGVLIDAHGLVATISYLVTEAESVWLIDDGGNPMPAHVVGYDAESGLGLVQALRGLDRPAMTLGSAAAVAVSDAVIVASHGGVSHAMMARVTHKKEFAGYWEYVLDEAIFTVPAHPSWGGAALIGMDGRLCGIGSLLVQEGDEGGVKSQSNMFVPIDLLPPVLDDLLNRGCPNRPARPWLGVFVYDLGEYLVVAGVLQGCPAARTGLRAGDVLKYVDGQTVGALADLFRTVWRVGPAGVEIPLTIIRDGNEIELSVRSVDRHECLKSPIVH